MSDHEPPPAMDQSRRFELDPKLIGVQRGDEGADGFIVFLGVFTMICIVFVVVVALLVSNVR